MPVHFHKTYARISRELVVCDVPLCAEGSSFLRFCRHHVVYHRHTGVIALRIVRGVSKTSTVPGRALSFRASFLPGDTQWK